MPWYRKGTVAIAAGQTTVSGTGTNFALNARVGDAFLGPDGRWYEVANIPSSTVLSILPAYLGENVASGTYAITPVQGYVKESADRLRAVTDGLGEITQDVEWVISEETLSRISAEREAAWVEAEMPVVADQLIMLEDEDPAALPGTARQWRDYRIALRAWKDGTAGYPQTELRPARPT